MEYVDIINHIVEAEQRAQEIANAAMEKREHLSSNLQEEVKEMRNTHLERAKKRVAVIERQMHTETDEKIAELDEDLKNELASVNAQAQSRHQEWIDKLFSIIIDRDFEA